MFIFLKRDNKIIIFFYAGNMSFASATRCVAVRGGKILNFKIQAIMTFNFLGRFFKFRFLMSIISDSHVSRT